jgi:hypothetical protein
MRVGPACARPSRSHISQKRPEILPSIYAQFWLATNLASTTTLEPF